MINRRLHRGCNKDSKLFEIPLKKKSKSNIPISFVLFYFSTLSI